MGLGGMTHGPEYLIKGKAYAATEYKIEEIKTGSDEYEALQECLKSFSKKVNVPEDEFRGVKEP
jgi:chaperonin GroEL (HSP60 family)